MKKMKEWAVKSLIVICVALFSYAAITHGFWGKTLIVLGVIFFCIMIPVLRIVIKKMIDEELGQKQY